MTMKGKGRSNNLTRGEARAPHRSLLKGLGFTSEEIKDIAYRNVLRFLRKYM